MTFSVSISPDAERILKEKAVAAGVDLETYAARQLELMNQKPSLREISGSIAKTFADSGMTEDELADFLDQEIHAMRRERAARRAQ